MGTWESWEIFGAAAAAVERPPLAHAGKVSLYLWTHWIECAHHITNPKTCDDDIVIGAETEPLKCLYRSSSSLLLALLADAATWARTCEEFLLFCLSFILSSLLLFGLDSSGAWTNSTHNVRTRRRRRIETCSFARRTFSFHFSIREETFFIFLFFLLPQAFFIPSRYNFFFFEQPLSQFFFSLNYYSSQHSSLFVGCCIGMSPVSNGGRKPTQKQLKTSFIFVW